MPSIAMYFDLQAYMSRPLNAREFYSLEAPGVASEATERFRRLCFGLSFFHGVVVSRTQVRRYCGNWIRSG